MKGLLCALIMMLLVCVGCNTQKAAQQPPMETMESGTDTMEEMDNPMEEMVEPMDAMDRMDDDTVHEIDTMDEEEM